jgi:hypothetical protein
LDTIYKLRMQLAEPVQEFFKKWIHIFTDLRAHFVHIFARP